MNGIDNFSELPYTKINPSFFTTNTGGLDPDVNSFISSALITDPNEINALIILVKKLKECGFWDKLNVIYPFIGGTARSHSRNLKDPRDQNSSNRITWAGSMFHTRLGVEFVGVNGFGETHYLVSGFTNPWNMTLGCYIIGNLPTNTNTKYILGNSTTSRVVTLFEFLQSSSSKLVFRGSSLYGGGISWAESQDIFSLTGSIIATRGRSLYTNNSVTHSPVNLYYNGQEKIYGPPFGTISFLGGATTQTIKIGTASSATSNLPVSTGYTNAKVQFIFWANTFLNATEATTLAKIIEDFQSALKRSLLRNCNEYIPNQIILP